MAPNTQPAINAKTQYDNGKLSLRVSVDQHDANREDERIETKTSVDKSLLDDTHDPVVLGPRASMIVTLIVLSFYVAGAWFLFNQYKDNYFKKNIPATQVPNLLFAWTPLYFLAALAEGLFAYYKGAPVYETADTICSLSTYSIRLVTTQIVSMTIICYGAYGLIWDYVGSKIHAAVFPMVLQDSPLFQFVGIIILDEFAYYWVHRFGHTINTVWIFHQVHHNGEVFNLASGIRNSIFVRFSTIFCYLPLALLFDPPVFIIFRQFNLVYQFWIHNQVIGKLGWLEYILNTPSQHRVHHGRNKYCIDTNFGGMTCIFDRLFGTFQEELEEVPIVYGLTTSINTFDPWKLNWYPMKTTFQTLCSVPGIKQKFLVLWNGPGRVPMSNPPEEYPIPPATRKTFQIRKSILSTPVKVLLVFEVMLSNVVTGIMKKKLNEPNPEEYWYFMMIVVYCGYAMFTVACVSDHNKYAGLLQLTTVIWGFSLFSVGSLMHHTAGAWIRTVVEISIYFVLSVIVTCLIFTYKTEIEKPLPETHISKDLPNAKEACEAQWNYYLESRKKQKTQ